MILVAKEIHNLKKVLTDLDKGPVSTRKFCVIAKIDIATKVQIEDVLPWKRWSNIIEEIKGDAGRMAVLLNAVHDEYKLENNNNENPDLKYYLSEITTKNAIRLAKLASLLKEKKCVLFLGPDVLRVSGEERVDSFNTHLCNILESDLNENYIYYDSSLKDNLSYMAQRYTEMPNYVEGEVQRIAKKEFDKIVSEGTIQTNLTVLLAKLPAKLIINANPDILFQQYIESSTSNKCLLASYDISNNAVEEQKKKADGEPAINQKAENDNKSNTADCDLNERGIKENEVLLYNIFGTFEKKNSILYTESQFLEFINNVIFGSPGLDLIVRNELNVQESYLFIGFDFEQWYFKILFQLLKLKKEKDKAISCNVTASSISTANKEFFEEEFKVYFVDVDTKKFILDLLKRLQIQ